MISRLENDLHDKSDAVFIGALHEATSRGEEGDKALSDALAQCAHRRRMPIIFAVGDASGSSGTQALERLISDPGAERDLRCAALLSYAKRAGPSGSEVLRSALGHRDGAVKDYAVNALAAVGDAQAWDDVLHRLTQLLARDRDRGVLQPTSAVSAICYLARHVEEAGSERCIRLVETIRRRWSRLNGSERGWVLQHWHECAPDGPEPHLVRPPDGRALAKWMLASELFNPRY
jgi:hypothetical protein